MKCPACGRENPDIRLFCMHCGAELPDNTETTAPFPSKNPYARPTAAQEAQPQPGPAQARPRVAQEAPAQPDNPYARPAAVQEAPHRPELNRQKPAIGNPSTVIPKREPSVDPDDLFSVRGQVLPDYDEAPEPSPKKRKGREGDYEEAPQSFATRHMRGIVTLSLLALTAAIVLIWANTSSAQYTLAKMGIAWKSEAYVRLAEEARIENDLSAVGYYYAAALERDDGNRDYAILAANAYLEGGYTGKSLEMLRKCIALEPTNVELYIAMLQLQPDVATMTHSDRQLIKKGYELTGDNRLNIE